MSTIEAETEEQARGPVELIRELTRMAKFARRGVVFGPYEAEMILAPAAEEIRRLRSDVAKLVAQKLALEASSGPAPKAIVLDPEGSIVHAFACPVEAFQFAPPGWRYEAVIEWHWHGKGEV